MAEDRAVSGGRLDFEMPDGGGGEGEIVYNGGSAREKRGEERTGGSNAVDSLGLPSAAVPNTMGPV